MDADNRNLREEGAWQKTILETIGSNGHDREIISKLRRGDSHQSIAEWLHRGNPDFAHGLEAPPTHRRLIDVVKLYETQCQQDDGLSRQSSSPSAAEIPWTKVTISHKLIGHLFDLYFTWVHPVHMLFSEIDFKHDFKETLHTNCSASLVNAICAMGCNLLESEDVGDRRNRIDAATLRNGFMNEARATLDPSSYSYMTSVQTLAIMFLVELSSGKARKAIGYLRSAVDNLKTSNGPQLSEKAHEITVWGLHTLNTYVKGNSQSTRRAQLTGPGLVLVSHIRSFTLRRGLERLFSDTSIWIEITLCGVSTDIQVMSVNFRLDQAMRSWQLAIKRGCSGLSMKVSTCTAVLEVIYQPKSFLKYTEGTWTGRRTCRP